ncbi:hypothetical protein ACFRCI_50025 [Streptomyces sp. NPDC056638]|uniref:hypothetical protein n=1 Tax=Streptomyces sp. NPDC056638 TaxID=3345887 RepID=UPI0036883717
MITALPTPAAHARARRAATDIVAAAPAKADIGAVTVIDGDHPALGRDARAAWAMFAEQRRPYTDQEAARSHAVQRDVDRDLTALRRTLSRAHGEATRAREAAAMYRAVASDARTEKVLRATIAEKFPELHDREVTRRRTHQQAQQTKQAAQHQSAAASYQAPKPSKGLRRWENPGGAARLTEICEKGPCPDSAGGTGARPQVHVRRAPGSDRSAADVLVQHRRARPESCEPTEHGRRDLARAQPGQPAGQKAEADRVEKHRSGVRGQQRIRAFTLVRATSVTLMSHSASTTSSRVGFGASRMPGCLRW